MSVMIPDFRNVKALVVGDVLLDRYWHGDVSRISPEAPVPVVQLREVEERPGGAANVALNMAVLGCHVQLLAVTGQDESADRLQQLLEAQGVQCHFIREPSLSTIVKLRVLGTQQQLVRVDFEKMLDTFDQDSLLQHFKGALSDIDVVVLSDYAKGTLKKVSQQLIDSANLAGIPVLVGPKNPDFSVYSRAQMVIPNWVEFQSAVGPVHHEEEIVLKGRQLIDRLGFKALLVTRGKKGMTFIPAQGDPVHLPALAKEVCDVTGAGDTVLSTLSAGLASGLNWLEACQLANLAASVVVGKLGVASVRPSELKQAGAVTSDHRILTEEELFSLVQQLRQNGEKIVMTNGCFDILHLGHVSYLEQARALGDCLIVAVNTDESVRRFKGPERPINPIDKRMAVLASLKAVDWVVPFVEDTPRRLISRILPDILVKGSDYTVEQIAGAKEVLAHGGRVELIDLVEGCSTTHIIKKIGEYKK